MARSGRLGIAGEVSAGPDPEVHKKSAAVTQFDTIPFVARIRTGVFLIGKTIIGRFSNKKLLEHRPMLVFPIRSCARPEFVRARRGRGFFSTQRLQISADWVLSTQSSPAACAFGGWQEFGWLRLGSGFRYIEIADSWRLDFIYTEIADTLVVAGLARR